MKSFESTHGFYYDFYIGDARDEENIFGLQHELSEELITFA